MRDAGKGEAARNHRCRPSGDRLTQGEQQKAAGQQSAKETEPRGTDVEERAQAQNRDSLEGDEREDDIDKPRLDHEVDHAFSVRRRLGQ
jgi:hypothetical protein